MPLIERYIFRRIARAFLVTLGALVATVWLTQVLRELDLVTAKGQTIWLFLVMTVLALPSVVQIIAPIAYLVAAIATLNTLNGDSELAAISASGAPRRAVSRPILLFGLVVTLAVALLHHAVSPASLAALRTLITKVRADLIATVVKDGGFRSVEQGLTIHIRDKAADGSFRGIFVSDDRDAAESLQYTAEQGLLLENPAGSFLVMKDGNLIRENRASRSNTVVEFETYAFDLSQLSAAAGEPVYKARERSTPYLVAPDPDDAFVRRFPERVAAELHDRVTAPLYTLAFGLLALAFLGRPRTNRQDRSFATLSVLLIALLLRGAGFAVLAAAGGTASATALVYLVPVLGLIGGGAAMIGNARLRIPAPAERLLDRLAPLLQRLQARFAAAPTGAP